ncbi:MAG: hypothetical protein OXF41_13160 [bacterium]|nr:hypothetical protein [bacterium]
MVWAAPTARLLGRYLTDRTHGPVFPTRWRTRTEPAARDLYAATVQARLTYRTAASQFKSTPEGGPSTNSATPLSPTSPKQERPPSCCKPKPTPGPPHPVRIHEPGVEAVAQFTADQFDRPAR